MNQRIKRVLDMTKGLDVLHVGCAGNTFDPKSPYWLHHYLCEKFDRVIGIDINTNAVNVLTAHGYKVICANAEELDLEQRFDTIVAGELIEHLSNPGKFFDTAKRHLKPGGRLVITTPYPFSAMYFLYALIKFPKTCSNPEHTAWFCPSTIREISRRYGYKIVHLS